MDKFFHVANIRTGYLLVMKNVRTNEVYAVTTQYNDEDELGCCAPNQIDWFPVKSLTPELEHKMFTGAPNSIVMEIYGRTTNARMLDNSTAKRQLLWKREPETKQMTIKEIEDKLGYKVEIVAEHPVSPS